MYRYPERKHLLSDPTAPLVRPPPTHGLSRRCVEALSGVFRTHDVDGDGVLTDADVASVQRRSFRVPLAPGELDGLKAVCANGLDGGVVDGSGWKRRERVDAERVPVRARVVRAAGVGRRPTWTVLRAHGYDDDLEPIEADDEAEEGTAEGEAVRSVEGIAAGARGFECPVRGFEEGGRRGLPRRGRGARWRRAPRVADDERKGRGSLLFVLEFGY